MIHPASINAKIPKYSSASQRSIELIGYQDLVESTNNDRPGNSRLLMLNTTPVSVLALLLNCGSIVQFERCNEEEGEEEDDEVWEDIDEDEDNFPTNQRTVVVEVDGWLKLKLDKEVLSLIEVARIQMMLCMKSFVNEPSKGLEKISKKKMEAIVKMISIEQAILST